VQVVFTVAPDAFSHRVARYLDELGALVLPWDQAIRERFDLAVAAAYTGVHEVHAPLVVMAHGAGRGKLTRAPGDGGPLLDRPTVYGLDAARLIRDGRVLASAVLLSHEGEWTVLKRQCPEALPVAVVAGDPCFDRLVASMAWRDQYRVSLGLSGGQELVAVSSTWGPHGLFGQAPDLLPRLLDQLPAERYRVGVLLHPAVWTAHGYRQIRAWLRDCSAEGLILLDPMEDWRAMLVAADYVVGDHGSVTAYGAAIGKPVLPLASISTTGTAGGSAQDLVLARARRLDPDQPVLPQLRAAAALDTAAVTAALTSCPGEAARLIRRAMYRLLQLTEPGGHRRPTPVPLPRVQVGVLP